MWYFRYYADQFSLGNRLLDDVEMNDRQLYNLNNYLPVRGREVYKSAIGP